METAYHPLSTMDTTHQPVSPSEKRPSQLARVSVTSFFSRKSSSRSNYTTTSRPRSQIWHWLALFVAFLWLLPIAALLALNFKTQVLGPSAWCPLGHCQSDVGSENAIMRANRLDKNDHNLLGALQFVAKALEVWFMFIATALLYDMAMIMARQEGGLPVGYLLTHLEFSDIRNLFNPTLWTSPFPHSHATHSQKHRKSVSRLFFFGLLAALLTVLANLMGPATAVLVLPTLQYINTPHKVSQIYRGINLEKSPTGDTALDGCDAAQLNAGNYSCTSDTYSSSLDQFAASAAAGEIQYQLPYGNYLPVIAQESSVMFSVNVTSNDSVIWIPNRQVLADLSRDWLQLYLPDHYGYPATPINESLQLTLSRQGPSIGFDAECYAGNVTMVEVAKDKQVHCFGNWTEDAISYYTQCIRVGSGFNAANTHASIKIGNNNPNVTDNSTALDVYYSDLITYYNATFNAQIIPCISNKTAPQCDWDALFALPAPYDDPQQPPNNLLFLSFSLPNAADEDYPYQPNSRLFCHADAHISFPTYTLDTLPSANLVQLVRMQGLSPKSNSLPISPSWLLAAFSADADPTSAANTVDPSRAIAQAFSSIFYSAWLNANSADSFEWNDFTYLMVYSLGQAMSMVRYEDTNITASSSTASTSTLPPSPNLNPKSPPIDPTTPRTLHTWSTRHVWAYSIYASRTSKLGAAVVILGALCVLLRLVLGIALGKREHSPVELFVAALQHEHRGEFEGLDGEEGKVSKVRYVMVEESGEGDGKEKGRLRFVPEERWGGGNGT